jgi:cell wall-associated NlpC family hydrolase
MINSVGSSGSYSQYNPSSSTTSAPEVTQRAQETAAAQEVASQQQQAQAFQQNYLSDSMSQAPADYSSLSGVSGASPASLQQPSAAAPAGTSGVAPAAASGTSGQQAVDTASSYMGTPYNYPWDRSYTGAGTDPNGLGLMGPDGSIDCSQLTSLAHGGTLPADAATQGAMGPAMDPSSAQPGDIIAFDEHGTGEASHVGIADGQGNVIHASAYTGDVTVTPIADIPSFNTWAVRPS